MMPSLHSVLISKTLVIYFTLFFNVFKKFVLLFNATTNLNGYIVDIGIIKQTVIALQSRDIVSQL